jgi:hypothetical protein
LDIVSNNNDQSLNDTERNLGITLIDVLASLVWIASSLETVVIMLGTSATTNDVVSPKSTQDQIEETAKSNTLKRSHPETDDSQNKENVNTTSTDSSINIPGNEGSGLANDLDNVKKVKYDEPLDNSMVSAGKKTDTPVKPNASSGKVRVQLRNAAVHGNSIVFSKLKYKASSKSTAGNTKQASKQTKQTTLSFFTRQPTKISSESSSSSGSSSSSSTPSSISSSSSSSPALSPVVPTEITDPATRELLKLEMETMAPDWFNTFAREIQKPYFLEIKRKLKAEKDGKHTVYPSEHEIYTFTRCPLRDVRVVILGQGTAHFP